MDPNIKQSIIDRLKQTNNVLVTVKANPTVDQLAACIGLTLFLNKQGKHATAVFSGAVPSTIEFLKPEETLEKDTNSLRDFIIALDKSKADKLRYKVEDKVVKIFITPYRTSLSQDDLDFSQGDFNVDVVIALGVHAREELDQAIVAHGRILHDATVVSINNSKAADLGALNWNDDKASSLCEMTAGLVESLQPNSLDAQMATAFLTGVVAETDRFSNPKTTSVTMSLSAKLMAAGANQQLVATKLQEPTKVAVTESTKDKDAGNGTIEIAHVDDDAKTSELPELVENDNATPDEAQIHIDDDGNLKAGLHDKDSKSEDKPAPGRLTLEPPTMGGTLTGSTFADKLEPPIDSLGVQSSQAGILSHDNKLDKTNDDRQDESLSEPSNTRGVDITAPSQTLSSIEKGVKSPHLADTPPPASLEDLIKQDAAAEDQQSLAPPPLPAVEATGIDDARKAVEAAALSNLAAPVEPVQSLNSQPLGGDLHAAPTPVDQPLPTPQPSPTFDLPPNLVPPDTGIMQEQTGLNGQAATPPPPVPPPMMPPTFEQPDPNSLDAPL